MDNPHATLIAIMADWARWMARNSYGRGYPSQSIGISSGYVSSTFDDMLEGAHDYEMQAINAAIDDLPATYKKAIHNRYLETKYYIEHYMYVLAKAHDDLYSKCKAKGLHV